MNNYKVCILTAGVGSRLGKLSKNINKAILPIGEKAGISHIVEKFPKDIEIVVALGHHKDSVVDYLGLAYPDRKFNFVEVDKYMGPGTGPGYSLLQCKPHLDCPFIFFASDTLVLEEIPEPKENWFGIAPVKETEKYCTVKIKNNQVIKLEDKVKCDNKFAFIGLAGIKNHKEFFEELEKNKEVRGGEIQVSNGFQSLIQHKLNPIGFTWFDTGSLESYKETNQNFSKSGNFDFSKGDEFIYFVNERVIKYFADTDVVEKRYERSNHLKGLCPIIEGKRKNFYSYKKIEGNVLYNVLNRQLVIDFLKWSKLELWKKGDLDTDEKKEFNLACKKFYKDKTLKRLEKFYEKTGIEDDWSRINGVQIPPLKDLLDEIDWEYLYEGVPTRFHGDLQFDNVLVKIDDLSNLHKFILLDWRHEFGGMTKYGDLYYDLSKLYGGVNISYQLIKKGEFSFDMSGSSVYYNYSIKNDLLEAKEEFEKFIESNGYDLRKIKLITALIFLNMSPLHHDPFDLMLYHMGKSKLYYALKGVKNIENDKA